MSSYVWCKKEECRLPSFRCLLCREGCPTGKDVRGGGNEGLEALIKSGKYKEQYVMKRKEETIPKEKASSATGTQGIQERGDQKDESPAESRKLFLMDNGRLRPLSTEDYTPATLYQMVESYSVECRLVRPEETANLVFEGKKPSKKTIPIIVTKNGDTLLLDSWESLESNPEQLAEAVEVMGASPARQVFVLRRKED
jgi:hypothetical protein